MAALFADDECGPAREPEPPMSRGRKLTQRRRAMLAAGIHPITRRPLLPAEQRKRCRDCAHLFIHGNCAGDYPKCDLNATRGEATDVRVRWPACVEFQPREPQEPAG